MLTLIRSRPTIEVGDLGQALGFLTDVVGFTVTAVEGEPPMFALVGEGPSEIALVEADDPAIPAGAACYVTIGGLDELVQKIVGAGFELALPVTERPWGLRDLVVRLPGDGPLVAFGEAIGR